MSLEKGLVWSHQDIRLIGYSLAGITTSIGFPQAGALMDVGQGLPFQIPFQHILLTHGHMDHAGGLPYLLGQKAMQGSIRTQVYMPEALLAPMTQIMDIWSKIEDHTYDYDFHIAKPGQDHPLKGNYFFRTFATHHRVPSTGYTVFEHKKRLRPEFQGRSPEELGRLRHSGAEIEEKYIANLLSFTGDTKIEFLESAQARESQVLVMEVTFWDDKRNIEAAREWGHIHFDELVPRLEQIQAEKIVLIHNSVRYAPSQIEKIIAAKVSAADLARLELFPRSR